MPLAYHKGPRAIGVLQRQIWPALSKSQITYGNDKCDACRHNCERGRTRNQLYKIAKSIEHNSGNASRVFSSPGQELRRRRIDEDLE